MGEVNSLMREKNFNILIKRFMSQNEIEWSLALEELMKYQMDFIPMLLEMVKEGRISGKKANDVALFLFQKGYPQIAIRVFQFLIEREKEENAAHLNNYAYVLANMGNRKEARKYFYKAWKIDLKSGWLRSLRLPAFKNLIKLLKLKFYLYKVFIFIFNIVPLLKILNIYNTFNWISLIIPQKNIPQNIAIEILKILIQVNGFFLSLTGVLVSFILRYITKEYRKLLHLPIIASLVWFLGAIFYSTKGLIMLGTSQTINTGIVLFIPLNYMSFGVVNTFIAISMSIEVPREYYRV